ncbi:insulinase family protein, partial [Candidatus Babeliales bacterium]|nr:insulinase family protein [Candidatus Babeliales bacterium]
EELMEEGIFGVFVAPKDGKRERCRELILEELAKFVQKGVTQEEIDRSVAGGMTSFFSAMENPTDLVMEWLETFFATGDELEVFKTPEKYYQVKPDAVQKFVANYLDPFLMQEVNLVSLPEGKRELWQASKKREKKIEVDILQLHQRSVPIEEPRFVKTLPDPASFKFEFPQPTEVFSLENGLRVLFYHDDSLPLVTANLRFRDSEKFSKSREGLVVDLMMEMLIEGSTNSNKQENVEFFKALGADYSFDSAGGAIACLNANFETALERFFYVLREPAFKQEALAKLKQLSISGLQRSKDNPRKVAMRTLACKVNAETDYEWTYDDAIELVNAFACKDLEVLHKEHLKPEGMVLSVAGGFDIEKVREQLSTLLKQWDGARFVQREAPKRHFLAAEKIDVNMLRDQAVLMFGQPSPITVYDEDKVALNVLNFIAFYSLGSRLYQLRERTGLFYAAGGAFAAQTGREPGFDYLMALLSPEKFEEAEQGMRDVVKNMAENGITEVELNEAKQLYLNTLVSMASTRASVAGALSSLETKGLGFDYYQRAWDRVRDMSVANINALCKKYCTTDKMVRIRVGRV